MNTRILFALATMAALCTSSAMAIERYRGGAACADGSCANGGEAGCDACGGRGCHKCCHHGCDNCYGKQNNEAARRAATYTWHGNYYEAAWATPVALVVPPTAAHQTHYSWGVPSTRVTRIDHQFQRPYPGPYVGPATGGPGFAPTPHWPSDTRQFGVYYVRGPW